MKRLILSVLTVLLLGVACCGNSGSVSAEAVITKINHGYEGGNCQHTRTDYKLAKYPKYTHRKIYDTGSHPTWAEGDTIIVKVSRSTMEDLLNLYLGEEL